MSSLAEAASGPRLAVLAPVQEVTVHEDRAHVTRRGELELPAGQATIVVEEVAPVLCDKTLSIGVRCPATGVTAAVRQVHVERSKRILAADRPEAIRGLEDQARELARRLDRWQEDRALLARQASGLRQLREYLLEELAEDAAWGRPPADDQAAALRAAGDREREHRAAALSLGAQVEQVALELVDLRAQLGSRASPSVREAARLVARLEVPAAGTHEVQISYIVPNACWRPVHRARLLDREGRLEVETEGCVWQNTGEDWKDVRLRLSTQRTSLGAEPPKLRSEVLSARKKEAGVVVEQRQQVIQATAPAGARPTRPSRLPGIDDAGEPLTLGVAAPAVIPSDGRPYRVGLARFQAAPKLDLVCRPELASCVFVRTVQTHPGPSPLLAGPLDLVRASGYVGRSATLFVASGGGFELGWGADAEVRVHRKHDRLEEEKSVLSGWISQRHHVCVQLSNLAGNPKEIELVERVPVSEIEQVQVLVDEGKTTDARRPDRDGFLRWTVRLEARGHARIDVHYTVRRRKEVVGL